MITEAVADSVYRTLYDVRDTWPNTIWIAVPVGAVAAIGGWILRDQVRNGVSDHGMLSLAWAMFGIGSVGLLLLGWASVLPYVLMRADLARGEVVMREGTVKAFTPGDRSDHREESWILHTGEGEVRYSYSPSRASAGYDRTVAHGGLIRDGARLRITEVHSRIARLEMLQFGAEP